jgi:hypothetical protein
MTKSAVATEAQIRRALRAVMAAGLPVSAVEVSKDGHIVVRTAAGKTPQATQNEWDVA